MAIIDMTGASAMRLGKHAVVIGASMAGSLAARVLSDYFDEVTLVERDAIPADPEPRKGVPQGWHVHTLYGGGAKVVEELLPGVFDELVGAGSTICDFSKDLVWFHQGVWKMRIDTGLLSYWQSRGLLEHHVRRRAVAVDNIRLVDDCEVAALTSNGDQTRVTGVQLVHRRENNREETVAADFVVDTSGRASKLPAWLAELGYDKPAETKVEIDLCYASRIYQRPPDDSRDWQVMGQFPTPPDRNRVGYIFPIEGQRWIVSAVGYLGDHPPDDEAGYLEFARSMELPDFYEAIKDAKPLTPIVRYKYPSQQRRRYEKLARFPDGIVALGDAVCSFNPVYGQGMSAAALQVNALRDVLDQFANKSGSTDGLPRRFFAKIAKIIDNPWLLATNSDFMYPKTGGHRPLGTALLNWYVKRVLQLCSGSPFVLKSFLQVLHFIKGPAALFHPYIVLSVFKRAMGFRGSYNPSLERPKPE